jgi:pimeloyl-ACP methyl ester carboxylesterase
MLVVVAFLIGNVLIWSLQRYIVYPGSWVEHVAMPPRPVDAESWWQDTQAGAVEAWFMLGRGRSEADPGPAVMYFHGNGELIDIWPLEMRWFTDRGISVLLPEYRGYGRSVGSPSDDAIADDMRLWRDRLAGHPAVDGQHMLYFGRSLGGGVAAELTRTHPPAALILASTFTSVLDVARGLVPAPGFMVRDHYPVLPVLESFDGPVLIMHGEEDGVLDAAMARANHEAASRSRLVLIPGAGHNDMPPMAELWPQIEPFLREAGLLD